jgi:hypothetical protein
MDVDLRKQGAGRKLFFVDVEYEDPQLRTARVEVEAVNAPEVQVLPAQVTMTTYGDETARAQFCIIDYRETPLKVTDVKTTSPELQAMVVEHPHSFLSGWFHTVEILAKDGSTVDGISNETVSVLTSDHDHRQLDLPVEVVKRGCVRVAPMNLVLCPAPNEESVSGELVLCDVNFRDVIVESVECDSGREM